MNYNRSDRAVSHNVHCVKNTTAHYRQCQPGHEETLLEKICAGAVFVACVTLLMFMG